MVDVHTKTNFISPDMNKSPTSSSPSSSNKLETLKPPPSTIVVELSPASDSACSAYEHYFRLPELNKLHDSKEFPAWRNESIIKPALQGLEISFHLISTVLFDSRVYTNKREWKRRLERLATSQLEIIASLCEDDNEDTNGSPPTAERHGSEISLLSQLAMWGKTEDIAQKILYTIDRVMSKCLYTLGLGEMNATQKPSLDYDQICKPWKINALMNLQNQVMNLQNYENKTLYITQQLLETWIYISNQLIDNIVSKVDQKDYEKASTQCWLLEKIWKLLTEIEELHLLMDPDDFLRLKNQLSIKNTPERDLLCFRSKGLVEITRFCKELRHKVPEILEVEADPRGGPRIQEAAMRLYRRKRHGGFERIHLLQALQAVEMAVKCFYFSYKQLLVIVLGSLEANGNKGFGVVNNSGDLLNQIFLEPTYYPSLDAAKTFLGYYWSLETELTRW